MTGEQRTAIRTIKALGYKVRVVKRIKYGILLIRVPRKLDAGNLPLRLYPDGTYMCPWYDSRNSNSRRTPAWHH